MEKKDLLDLGTLEDQLAENRAVVFPVEEEEVRRRYEAVSTPMINDVLRAMGYLYQTLPTDILPLRDHMRVCGVAFTVKGSKNLALENEMVQRAEMLESITPGSVVVWDTCGDTESAQWGEMMSLASMKRGCRGAIVDGGCRDTDKILELDFPLFCKYRTSNGMLGRFRITGYQIPVRIGQVTITPGDFVSADIDGAIVIPRKIAYEVLVKAEEILENEKGIRAMIEEGATPMQVVKNGGYF